MISLVSPVSLNYFKKFIQNSKKYLEKSYFNSFNQICIRELI